MCHIEPTLRITAKDALKHPFFSEVEENEMIIESQEGDKFLQYKEQ